MDFISHCIKRSRWKLEGRATIGLVIILIAFSLLGWIYLTQASYVAMTSRQVQELEAEKIRLQQENLELITDIARLEAVTALDARARELGFVPLVVEDADFLAIAPLPPAERDSPDEGPPATRWWDTVVFQFEAWTQVRTP